MSLNVKMRGIGDRVNNFMLSHVDSYWSFWTFFTFWLKLILLLQARNNSNPNPSGQDLSFLIINFYLPTSPPTLPFLLSLSSLLYLPHYLPTILHPYFLPFLTTYTIYTSYTYWKLHCLLHNLHPLPTPYAP